MSESIPLLCRHRLLSRESVAADIVKTSKSLLVIKNYIEHSWTIAPIPQKTSSGDVAPLVVLSRCMTLLERLSTASFREDVVAICMTRRALIIIHEYSNFTSVVGNWAKEVAIIVEKLMAVLPNRI